MKKLTILATLILGITMASCDSRTKRHSIKMYNTPILVLNDSIHAINFKHLKDNGKDFTLLTLQCTYKGETRTIVTTNYITAYAMPVDSINDVAIGYFIKKIYFK